jgi:putative ABC transport system ATP-binding protein
VLFDLRDISFSRGDEPVLRDISTDIPTGTTSIVGPSGAGKSTLLRLLNRLADPDSGEIDYKGRPLTEYDPLALRREVSLVSQLPALGEGSVADNIRYAASLAGSEPDCERALDLAGLNGSFADRPAGRLSVGEQQRAMLARSLAQNPKVLLLDEPTSALDEASRDAVEQTLLHLRREIDASIVLVSHDPAQARRLGDWVLRLEDGELVEAGPVERVLA